MANLSHTLEEDLKSLHMTFVLKNTKDYRNDNVSVEDADEIIVYYNDDEQFLYYTYKLPKNKLVDVNWVLDKWSKSTDTTYDTFSKYFKILLDKKGYKNSINVYGTTYGIGIFIAFGVRNQLSIIQQNVESIFIENDIQYNKTKSDAGWVLQYRISKSKSNLEKLKKITDGI